MMLHENTFLETPHCRFLIMDAPTDRNLLKYIEEMRKYRVTVVTRACKPSYDPSPLIENNIRVEEMFFDDGSPPSDRILSRWLEVISEEFQQKDSSIAVHCVAGLGRAPVLVAIALMERDKMDAYAAVERIREVRRGAINRNQLQYLENYQRHQVRCCGPCCGPCVIC
jgi:protein tyrosine phosphatase type 4A